MAIPSSGYSTADWTNPASDLTDFVGVVDLSDMPADFWTAVSSPDGTKGRVAKDDGTTELASHWIGFDDVAKTGFVWFMWSGTLSSTGTSTVRIYPPQSGNSSYSASATFGSQAVWADYDVVSHDGSVNSVDGSSATVTGTPDTVAGKIYEAASFDGSEDYSFASIAQAGASFGAWSKTTTLRDEAVIGANDGISDGQAGYRYDPGGFQGGGSDVFNYGTGDTGGQGETSSGSALGGDVWQRVIIVHVDSSSVPIVYIDGSQDTPSHEANITSSVDFSGNFQIGTGSKGGLEGEVEFAFFRLDVISADWASLEYDNQNDPTTFWGTWTWNAGASGTTYNESFSIGATNSIAQSAGAIGNSDISLGGQNSITPQAGAVAGANFSTGSQSSVDPSGGAIGNASMTVGMTNAITAIAEAIANGSLPVGSVNELTFQSNIDGAINVSFAIGSQNAIALQSSAIGNAVMTLASVNSISVDGALVTTESLSIAMQNSLSFSKDVAINVSLGIDQTNSLGITADAVANSELSFTLQSTIILTAQAIADAGITNATISSISISGGAVTSEVTFPDGRVIKITFETRSIDIEQEDRKITFGRNDRDINITDDQ